MGGFGKGRVEVIASKGCSRLFMDFSSSFRSLRSFSLEPMTHISTATEVLESPVKTIKSNSPFSGLVICVTGLSKEARKQVKEATEKLGGQYSPHLHPQCTHLVVQSSHGRKFEHALKHGPRNGLFLVTIGWVVDSVKKKERLNESLYSVNHTGETGALTDDLKRLAQNTGGEKSSPPLDSLDYSGQSGLLGGPRLRFSERESKRRTVALPFSGQSFYIDNGVSADLCSKVAEAVSAEGASLLDQWYVGCDANYIVCEGSSVRKYLGHSYNLVTPAWFLKSAKENHVQRLVHMSADLARQTGSLLDMFENGILEEGVNGITNPATEPHPKINISQVERQNIANLAKDGVRKRRNHYMQTCKTPLRPITPSSLLDSICWSISEPTSSASIYSNSSSAENSVKNQPRAFFETKEDVKESETSFVNLSRPFTESEKSEIIFKSHFLTILFPIDRFLEMGPRSRTFFCEKDFTCLQVLDYIHAFYQENMSTEEIEIAIHTDSRHADLLRLAYSSKETAELKFIEFKRIDFLGSRISFEMLKRVNGDNDSNVYELLIRG